jgi:hypothetical protein
MDWEFCIRDFFVILIIFVFFKKNLFWTVWAQTFQNYSGIPHTQFRTVWAQTVHNSLWTVRKKPSAIADDFTKTVRKSKYRPILLDGLKPSRKNSLDLFKQSRNPFIFYFFCSGLTLDYTRSLLKL